MLLLLVRPLVAHISVRTCVASCADFPLPEKKAVLPSHAHRMPRKFRRGRTSGSADRRREDTSDFTRRLRLRVAIIIVSTHEHMRRAFWSVSVAQSSTRLVLLLVPPDRYALISTEPLLANPSVWSERWHVLMDPKADNANVNTDANADASRNTGGRRSPAPPAGLVLLSLGFKPSGTPRPHPPSGTPRSAHSRHPSSVSVSAADQMHGRDATLSSQSPLSNVPNSDSARPSPPASQKSGTAAEEHGRRHTRDQSDASGFMAAAPDLTGTTIGVAHPEAETGEVRRGKHYRNAFLTSSNTPTTSVTTREQPRAPADAVLDQTEANGAHLSPDIGGEEEQRVHLFRIKTFPKPVWCDVCTGLLLGVSDSDGVARM